MTTPTNISRAYIEFAWLISCSQINVITKIIIRYLLVILILMRTCLPMVSLIENLMTKQNIGSYISITAIDEFWMSSVLSRLKMNQWERYRKCSIMRLQRPWKWSVNEEKRVALCLNDIVVKMRWSQLLDFDMNIIPNHWVKATTERQG